MRGVGLELLEHGRDVAPREDVAGQQQDGQAIDGGGSGAGDHVGGAGSDRSGAGERAQPVAHFGERGGGVHHGLLVAAEVVAEVGVFLQRFADAGDVAVSEDAEAAGEEALLGAVARNVLLLEEGDERLRHSEAASHDDSSSLDGSCRAAFFAARDLWVCSAVPAPFRNEGGAHNFLAVLQAWLAVGAVMEPKHISVQRNPEIPGRKQRGPG